MMAPVAFNVVLACVFMSDPFAGYVRTMPLNGMRDDTSYEP